MDFIWNKKFIKSRYLDPQQGRHIIVDKSALEIIADPNRHEFEGVIKALSVAVTALIKIQEDSAQRMFSLQTQTKEVKNGRPDLVDTGAGIP